MVLKVFTFSQRSFLSTLKQEQGWVAGVHEEGGV